MRSAERTNGRIRRTFLWLSAYAVILDRVRKLVRQGPVRRVTDTVAGCALMLFGVRVAASS